MRRKTRLAFAKHSAQFESSYGRASFITLKSNTEAIFLAQPRVLPVFLVSFFPAKQMWFSAELTFERRPES